jgi:arabinose-5-phosphate isomerase
MKNKIISIDKKAVLEQIKSVLEKEADSINYLISKLDDSYFEAVKEIINCKGRVIFSGIGKAGHIGEKLAATFSSLGTPAFFVHTAEAVHGDSGMVTSDDIVIFISNSGETAEVLNFLYIVKEIGSTIISMSGNLKSTLAKNSKCSLYAGAVQEADHLNLAPTSSSTAALALGDALAVAVSKIREFGSNDFKFYHPGGSLGKRLKCS